MRVLHVVPTYLPATRYGGPVYSIHGLCKALASTGHDVHVFTTNVDGGSDSDVPLGVPFLLDGVNIWYFPSRWLRRLYWSPPMMRTLKVKAASFDVIHLHSVFLWPTWAAARAARAQRVPYILSPRGMLVGDLIRRKNRWLKSAWIGLIERGNLRKAAAIHVTSEREHRDMKELGLAPGRIEVIPNGVDVDVPPVGGHLGPELETALRKGPCALYLGRLSWKKGLDRLIRAWRHVPPGHLLIAGNDDENLAPKLRKLIGDYGLEDRITLVARRIRHHEKWALFSRARVTVLPSYSENFGNVVLEAMATGCPMVVTPEVGAAEVVRAAHGGLVVEEQGLAIALEALLGEKAKASRMGARAREHVFNNYAWPRISKRIAKLYLDVVKSGRREGSASVSASNEGH